MKVFELLPRPLGKIFRKLTHLPCNSPLRWSLPIFRTLAMLCTFFVSKSKGDAALKQKKRGRVARAPLQSCFYQLFRLFLISKRRVKNGVAHAVSSCGVLFWTWGVCRLVMRRFEIFMRRFPLRHWAGCRRTGRASVLAACDGLVS